MHIPALAIRRLAGSIRRYGQAKSENWNAFCIPKPDFSRTA
jgi:hypothetical protein